MDSLPIHVVSVVLEVMPPGRARDFAWSRVTSHLERTGSMETSMRQALGDAIDDPQHGSLMAFVVERCVAVIRGHAPPPPPDETCDHCGAAARAPHLYDGKRYCSRECGHLAGDRRWCRIGGDCGCTPWEIKRRQLRKSRAAMRVMHQVLSEYNLVDVLARRMADLGDLTIGADDTMEEDSDAEDPMVTQATELSTIDNLVQLSRNMVELAGVRRGQKRARESDQDA